MVLLLKNKSFTRKREVIMREVINQFRHILNKGQKKELIGLFFLTLFGGVLETFSISVIIPYISVITNFGKLSEYSWGKWMMGIFPNSDERQILLYITLGLMLAFLLKNIYLYFLAIVQHHFAVKNYYLSSNKLFNIYINKPYSFFVDHSTSEIITIITQYISRCFAMLQTLLALGTELVVLVLLMLVLLIMNWKITVLTVVLVGGTSLVIRKPLAKRLTRVGDESNHQYTKMLQAVKQSFEGIKEIKIMNREEAFLNVYEKAGRENIRLEIEKTKYSAAPSKIVETITVWSVLLFVFILLFTNADMSNLFTQLTAMGLVVIRLTPCMNRINHHLSMISFYKPSVKKLSADIQEYLKETIVETKKKDDSRISFENSIRVEKLTFRYPNTDTNVLEDVSFEIKKGERVGIIGASGNGKTTLVDILMGYWKPVDGTILVDGQDIHENLPGWMNHIGYIPQMIFMMNASIFENVAFGYPDATEEEVMNALKQAQLDEFVKGLPEGVHTMIGEKGIRLSGGQRQRIGIARTLFQNPDVLIFDEATSALDTELESEITDAIYQISKEKTIIMIAHRRSTLRECDYILEVENETVTKKSTQSVCDGN